MCRTIVIDRTNGTKRNMIMYVYNESDRNYILIMGQGGTYDS